MSGTPGPAVHLASRSHLDSRDQDGIIRVPQKVEIEESHLREVKMHRELLRENESSKSEIDMLKEEIAKLKIDAEAYRCHRQCGDDEASKAFKYMKEQTIRSAIQGKKPFAKGGFGFVYKAKLHDRDVAIKLPRNQTVEEEVRQFHTEVRMLQRIRHPYIVILHGACIKICALVYEYLPNGNLEKRIKNGKGNDSFPWEERIQVAANISTALVYLHDSWPHRITHGDVKPANIIFDAENISKLGDFGISRYMKEKTTTGTDCYVAKTPMGTDPYQDPGFNDTYKKLTCRADQFAFGIILLQLVSGCGAGGLRNEISKVMQYLDNDSASSRIQGLCKEKLLDITWKSNLMSEEVALEMLDLGLQCSQFERKDRPNFKQEVWTKIKSIRSKVLNSRQ